MYKFFLFATFIATVWIPPLTFANHPFSARRRVNCSGRPPLDPAEDTLCGNTNTTQLECYRQRTRCNSMDRIDHWTSVCLFVVPTKRAEIAADFMENYKHYNCYVKGNFGKANCTSRTKPHLHFVSVCNFTYYYCRADPLACQMDFPMELEEGGRCPPPNNTCPTPNLFSLTNSFFSLDATANCTDRVNYTHLTKLVITPPARCNDDTSTTIYAILFAIVFIILVIAIGAFLFYKYRKMKAGVVAEMDNDAVIKMGERVLAAYDEFVKMHNSKADMIETVDPFVPKPQRNESEKASSSDTGFHDHESLIDDYANQLEDVSPESKTRISDSDTVTFLANPTYIKDYQGKDATFSSSDDESSAFKLRAYSLKKKTDLLDEQEPTIVYEPLGKDTPFPIIYPQNKKEFSTEFPGYLQKNVSEFSGFSSDINAGSAIPSYLRKTDLIDS